MIIFLILLVILIIAVLITIAVARILVKHATEERLNQLPKNFGTTSIVAGTIALIGILCVKFIIETTTGEAGLAAIPLIALLIIMVYLLTVIGVTFSAFGLFMGRHGEIKDSLFLILFALFYNIAVFIYAFYTHFAGRYK